MSDESWKVQGRATRGKTPFWGCGGCGFDRNFADRDKCWKCGTAGPRSAQDAAKQREAAKQGPKQAKATAKPSVWTAGPKVPSGAGTVEPASTPSTAPGHKSADAAARKIAELEKTIAEKDEQLQAQAQRSTAQSGEADADAADADGDEALAARVQSLEALLAQARRAVGLEATVGKLAAELEEARSAWHASWSPERHHERARRRHADLVSRRDKAATQRKEALLALEKAQEAADAAKNAFEDLDRLVEERRVELEKATAALAGRGGTAAPATAGLGSPASAAKASDLIAELLAVPGGAEALMQKAETLEQDGLGEHLAKRGRMSVVGSISTAGQQALPASATGCAMEEDCLADAAAAALYR